MSRDTGQLDPEMQSLLDVERNARPPEVALARVWSHLEQSVGATGPGAPRASGWFASHAGVLVALAFAAGGATGVGLTTALRKPTERTVYVERPAPVPASSAAPTAPTPAAPLAVVDVAAEPVAPHASAPRPAPGPSSISSLSAERATLDAARAALARNDGAGALALTEEHERVFAHPQLREEREAIAIQALVIEGRYDDARGRARRFRAASPDSLFLPAVDASLASIP
jgi:hypothetical protein